ncbi:MAG: hypothetical protein M1556_01400 [Candidatus Thermoplasmatota archaeon]|nr:hypothetical protein [Candidatus Thermoplasmatota archaeon]MCL6002291.1 hypothetical protein [Candidatus Thermoplasmatota archaeon]
MRLGWREGRMNRFGKEFINGRKGQWDIDFKIIMKGSEVSSTIDQCFKFLKENISFVITKISNERVDELMEELELI